MYTRLLFILLTIFSLIACQEAASTEAKYSGEELTKQQEAWDNMMEGHDIVMPMMTDIHNVAIKLENTVEAGAFTEDVQLKVTELLKELDTANDGMMDWMASVHDNPLDSLRNRYADHAGVMARIDKEKSTITKVGEEMKNSVDNAKALLSELEAN